MTLMGLPSMRTAQVIAQTDLDGIIIDYLIKRALDAGAHGLVVPQINSAVEANEVVANVKFPPQGKRGQGSAFPAIAHGIDMATYMRQANETIITCLQIESKAGVENVDAICAVPGVDMIFIGPNDLALSVLGYVPARGDEPAFVQAIEKIVAAARRHGKCFLCTGGNSDSRSAAASITLAFS
ncbi:hypothetical protein E4T48_05894 [Aureobasidium sp. EXF-10727]|nr:hypothetical protein E4T48_05894 [Aureobasidium sp. EXF-10727]